jgi:hypothetical protein
MKSNNNNKKITIKITAELAEGNCANEMLLNV